jgi:hypothetical protein
MSRKRNRIIIVMSTVGNAIPTPPLNAHTVDESAARREGINTP